MRGRATTLAASPTLVGAVTVLIVIVAVFLAYNANSGLPFVPTYRVSVQVPNASTLVAGNEVRVGGTRVGQILDVTPQSAEDGSVSAKVDLELNHDVEPLPADTSVAVRSRSALGLKYLEVTPGHSDQGLDAGSILPLSAAHPEPVELDQVFNIFDQPTRDAIQTNLQEFGNALAGRGGQLNAGLQELRPLLETLEPVASNLASPQTNLARFFPSLAAAAAEVAPVAENQAHLFVALDVTFGALARVTGPIQQAIVRGPPTENTVISTTPRIRPFIEDTTGLFADLRPGLHALAPASTALSEASRIGIPALQSAPAVNAQLPPTAQSLLTFSQTPSVTKGIADLTQITTSLDPTLAFVTPAQSVCNYGTLLFRNVSSLLSLGDGIGTWQRFITLNPPAGENNEGSFASAPASGVGGAGDNFLHFNPYPNTAAPGQIYECEAGNEKFTQGQVEIGNSPGNQGTETEDQLTTTTAQCKKGKKKDKAGNCVKKKKNKKKKKS